MIFRCLNQVRSFCSVAKKLDVMKYLCVAEKNDAAKTISSFLSRGQSQRREGLSKFNKIYEFEMDIRGQKKKVVFTSVSGHLLTYEFSNAYRGWQSCNPEQLFEAPVVKTCPPDYVNIKKTLEREAQTCQALIIWTDCDREGENIGYEVIDVCKAVNNRITVYRAKFSDMTAASISRAMNNLAQPDQRISNAVDVRSELDLRIGAAFTRFQTLRLQKVFPNNIEKLVSYGSCQIPTLGFVAQRYKEIENFIKKPFWKIKLTHKIDKLTVEFNWARNRLFDKACCEAFVMICQADGQAMITNVQQKPKNKWRPQPMDTVELEKTGSRKLKLSAKEIMTIAEKLYTQGFISYPRTETNMFSKDMNLRPLVEMQTAHPDWGEFANRVLEWGTNPRNGNKSDQAHPPIHPTKFSSNLGGNEKRVYELVVRHFLACVSRDAVGSETVVNATIGKEEFTATGLVILERNYLDVYIYDRWTGKEIHRYEVGNTFRPTQLCLHEGETNPPSMLTEADLIALMEKHGIGTDATHADHIATIKERGYIGVLDQGHLVPGILGMGLVEGYELMNLQLAQPRLRAGLEDDLKAICEGSKTPQAVLNEQIQKYKECYQIITREAPSLDRALGLRFNQAPQAAPQSAQLDMPANPELFKCPKCLRSKMIIRQKKENGGHFLSCQGYPDCRNAVWFPTTVKEISSLDEMCGGCGGENRKVKIKFNPVSTLGMVIENPAFSRIEESHYISCFVCDESLRNALGISAANVKVLGNIVGVQTHPNQVNNRNQGPAQPNLAPRNPPARGFSSHANPGDNQSQRRGGWNNDNDDDDRPSGGGAISSGSSSNRGWSNNHDPPRSTGTPSFNSNSSAGSSRGWDSNNSNSTSTNSSATKKTQNFPSINCNCNKKASQLVVVKESVNKGRPFYSCAERGKCGFFQWADVPLPAHLLSNNNNNTNSKGNNESGRASGTKRKCGICRQEGHTKLKCPSLSRD